ncbi:MAG: glycosyltransferase family 9 protein [Fluviicola sp.]
MNLKTKLALDRFLGVVVGIPLNYLVRLMGKIMRFDHTLDREMKKIVVCKFKGMGSIIQATPLLKTLRNRYPNAEIIFVTSIENEKIVSKITCINGAYILNDRSFFKLIGSSFSLIRRLIKFRADVYIDLEIYSNFSSIITTLSIAKERFGYYLRENRYRLGMYTHMMYFNTKAPISQTYLQFARLLSIDSVDDKLYEIEKNNSIQVEFDNYIVINPNASDLRYERRWPAENFIALSKKIAETRPELKQIYIGGPSESEYVKAITEQLTDKPQIIDLSGKTSIDELIEILRKTQLLITNDTGPMHLASCLNSSVIALFGPCSPSQYGFGENVYVVYKNVYCSPCVHEFAHPPCKGNNQCMQLISVDEVYTLFANYPDQILSDKIAFVGEENLTLGTVSR